MPCSVNVMIAVIHVDNTFNASDIVMVVNVYADGNVDISINDIVVLLMFTVKLVPVLRVGLFLSC